MFANNNVGQVSLLVDPPEARLALDGQNIVGASPYDLELEPGVYELAVRADGYAPLSHSLEVAASGGDEPQTLRIALEPSRKTLWSFTLRQKGTRLVGWRFSCTGKSRP